MSAFKDITGQTFGELTVVEMLHNYNNTKRMYCRCVGIDGNEYIIRQDALHSGATKHVKGACKAGKISDVAGKRFGKVQVLYLTNERCANSGIVWVCKCDCGNIFKTGSNNLKRSHTTSCGCNKQSIREKFITRHLKKLNIPFETEKTFEDLKNPKGNMHLYFDFYFPTKKLVIEYDGELHYVSMDFFGGEEKLKMTQWYDEIKNEYCKTHNIQMIRIPYTKTDNEIIEMLDNIICP